MRGSKLTNRCVYYSKDGNKMTISQDPLSFQLRERNLMLKGKMIRRKKTYKGHSQNSKAGSCNMMGNSLRGDKDMGLVGNFIRKDSYNVEMKHCSEDILSYLQMKCSQVYFRTQTGFQQREIPSHNGKTGVSLKRMPTSQSKTHIQNSISNVRMPSNRSTQMLPNPQTYDQPNSVLVRSTRVSVKPKPGHKYNPSPNKQNQSKFGPKPGVETFHPVQIINKDRALLSLNPLDLKQVKAQSFVMIQQDTEQLVLMHRGKLSLEIASLTKVMTAYVVLSLCQKHSINLKSQTFQVQEYIYNISGTSADLILGDIYTIEQLIYGLLLPSGNDAALVLADWAGAIILSEPQKSTQYKDNVAVFIQEMNRTAKQLGLKDTRYGNSHGLPHPDSRSTAWDQCKLARICMKLSLFRQVVKTSHYRTEIDCSEGHRRQVIWENTNKLLRREGFIGLKTGITVTAGPCLISAYQFKGKTYILAILRSNKVSRRFTDSRKIFHWALSNIYRGNTQFQESLRLQQLKKGNKDLDSDYSEDQHEFVYGEEGASELTRRRKILTNQL